MTRKHERSGARDPLLASRQKITRPAYLDWTQEQKNASAVPVLRGAFYRVAEGWAPPFPPEFYRNQPAPEGFVCLVEALYLSAVHPTGVDVWHARNVLERLGGPVLSWERHPLRTQREVLEFLRRAIARAGGEPPEIPLPANPRRRGGWHVGSGGC